MLFFRLQRGFVPGAAGRPPFGSSLFLSGTVCVLFGIAILSAPELLAYIVAGFFIFFGVSLFALWWRMRL